MIHTASCSTSHRVGGRGTESVSQREVCTEVLRMQKAQA